MGLADKAVREARERVRAALVNSGFVFPGGRITVNLAPADLRKIGPVFDLPLAVALLVAGEQVPDADDLAGCAVIGELALNGELRAVRGTLAIAEGARRHGLRRILLPGRRGRRGGARAGAGGARRRRRSRRPSRSCAARPSRRARRISRRMAARGPRRWTSPTSAATTG